jgi:uncharacterized protein
MRTAASPTSPLTFPPCKADPCPSYPPNVQARYVLELAAGVAAKHGLKDGDALRFEGMEHVVVR